MTIAVAPGKLEKAKEAITKKVPLLTRLILTKNKKESKQMFSLVRVFNVLKTGNVTLWRL